MPNMDGYEATEMLRELYDGHLQPRVVACTGHCEPQFIAKAWRHDMDEVAAKPINRRLLEQIFVDIFY